MSSSVNGRWCIVDLVGKHGRVRTAPMPNWVKVAIDTWTATAALVEGRVFRSVNRADRATGSVLSEKVVWQLIKPYAEAAGVPGIAPHDLRRTCARLCSFRSELASMGCFGIKDVRYLYTANCWQARLSLENQPQSAAFA